METKLLVEWKNESGAVIGSSYFENTIEAFEFASKRKADDRPDSVGRAEHFNYDVYVLVSTFEALPYEESNA